MIQPLFNGMIAILLAKFCLNDLPHAAGLTDTDYERPPTTRQLRYISILRQQLKMTVVYEEQVRTLGEAGGMIRELQEEKKYRKKQKELKGGNPSPVNLNLDEILPATPQVKPLPPFYSPKWAALHENVPRYVYHVPDGKVAFGKAIEAYKIQEPESADTFGRGYRENEYVWLSLKPIYAADAYVIDVTRLNNADMRFTGQAEGNLLHRGDIPSSAVVAIRRKMGEIMLPKGDNPNTAVGTCYTDAWRWLVKEESGTLVHGTVMSLGKRIGHAWVETDTGFIWEPLTGDFFRYNAWQAAAEPIEEHRYTVEEAAIMIARVGKHGPWTDEERMKWIGK